MVRPIVAAVLAACMGMAGCERVQPVSTAAAPAASAVSSPQTVTAASAPEAAASQAAAAAGPPASFAQGSAAVDAMTGASSPGTAGSAASSPTSSSGTAAPPVDVGASSVVGGAGSAHAMVPDAPLLIPVAGVREDQLVDTYEQSRSEGRTHEAIDILAPLGTPVRAVADGRVVKLFNSRLGGLTVYQFDRQERLAYYYAHLDAYAPGLKEGQVLRRGDLVGTVGFTGNASPEAPHLHFAVFMLGPERRWWEGQPLNPYPLMRSNAALASR